MSQEISMTGQDPKWKPLANEVNSIHNSMLRGFVQSCLNAAPDYFWTIPASTSGKYHPEASRGVGGLVHHTRMVVYIASSLVESWGCEAWRDEIIAAAILHDVYKYGDNPDDKSKGFNYWKDHGLHVRSFVERSVLDGEPSKVFHDQPEVAKSINMVLDLVARHMGKWVNLAPRPESREAWLIHTADMIASRKQINIKDFTEA